MASKRIYEVAKQYNISSNALVQMLRDLDHTVKSHMSVMDEKMVLDVNMRFEQEKQAARKEQDRKKRMASSDTATKPKAVKDGPRREKPKAEAGPAAKKAESPTTRAKTGDGDVRGRRRRSKKKKKAKVDQKEVEASVRRTIAQMDGTRTRRRRRRGDRKRAKPATRSRACYGYRSLFRPVNWPSIFPFPRRRSSRNACSSDS